MTRCPACARPTLVRGMACSCGWRPAAETARPEHSAEPGRARLGAAWPGPAWKEAVRQDVARHRQRRAKLMGLPEPPAIAPAAVWAPDNLIRFQRESGPGAAAQEDADELRSQTVKGSGDGAEIPLPIVPAPPAHAMGARAGATQLPDGGGFPATPVMTPLEMPPPPRLRSGAAVCLPAVAWEPDPVRAAVEFAAPAQPAAHIPLQVASASLGRRLAATLADGCCAGLVAGGFGLGLYAAVLGMGLRVAAGDEGVIIAAVGLVAFLTLQLLCLCRPMATPGMRCLRLTVCGLDGQPAPAARWRRRGCAVVLSLGALGLGYLWAYLDEEHLAWHDRLSETVLAPCG